MIELTARTLEVRGTRLSVLEGGVASAPPLVFLHGMRDVAWSLAPIATAFADRYRILMPELRGHGASDKPGAYGMENFLYDLHQQLGEFAAAPATLIGHSLGGQIAVRFAALFPELVSAAVIIEGLGPPARVFETDAPLVNYRQRLLDLFASSPSRRGFDTTQQAADRLLANNPRLDPQQARFLATKATRQDEDGRYRWNFDPLASQVFLNEGATDKTVYWRAVHCPTLIVSGDLSGEYWGQRFADNDGRGYYAEGEMDARAAEFADATHIPFSGSGHMVHFDEPDKLIHTIENFLQEQS